MDGGIDQNDVMEKIEDAVINVPVNVRGEFYLVFAKTGDVEKFIDHMGMPAICYRVEASQPQIIEQMELAGCDFTLMYDDALDWGALRIQLMDEGIPTYSSPRIYFYNSPALVLSLGDFAEEF